MQSNWNPLSLLMERQNVTVALENSLTCSYKFKYISPIESGDITLRYPLKRNKNSSH